MIELGKMLLQIMVKRD